MIIASIKPKPASLHFFLFANIAKIIHFALENKKLLDKEEFKHNPIGEPQWTLLQLNLSWNRFLSLAANPDSVIFKLAVDMRQLAHSLSL